MSEILVSYQNVYLEKLEKMKEEKRLTQELAKNGTIICPTCEQPSKKLLTAPTEKK